MSHVKFRLWSPERAAEIAAMARQVGFADGAPSASGRAKAAKANQEMRRDNGGSELLLKLQEQLLDSALIHIHAFPRAVAGLMINRYGPGETYGWHVDNSVMRGPQGSRTRTDFSFTIGLVDPDTYEGGTLEFYEGDTLIQTRLAVGEIILYPTGLLHRVTPVTRGERVSCVGWFQSLVADPEVRRVLTRMKAIALECNQLPNFPEGLALRQEEAYHMLLRRFAG